MPRRSVILSCHYNYMDNLLIINAMLFPCMRGHFEILKRSPYNRNLPVNMHQQGVKSSNDYWSYISPEC